ncbi:hypothetical protein, partial [Salmonella enterica]|uniref:hypothetical protein n=1 Tax=Salmonella enterica TaxID=28901 RepID=UPI0020CC1C8D
MKHFIRSIKMIWITMSISILCVSLLRLSQLDSNYDISELNSIMMYGMVIISFPTGIIFAIVLFLFLLSFGFIFTTIHSEYGHSGKGGVFSPAHGMTPVAPSSAPASARL